MGQKLTQSKQPIVPNVERFLSRNYKSFQFIQQLGNGLMTKTALITYKNADFPLLLKIFFKIDFNKDDTDKYSTEFKRFEDFIKELQKTRKLNVAPIMNLIDAEKACIVQRQYFKYNLKERIFVRPYLTQIEKIWIGFQILYGVNELHKNNLYHGDIKLENFVMNSYGSVYLTDLAPYKPVYIKKDDILSYTYYFGSNSNTAKSCNIAPERLIDKKTNEEVISTTTTQAGFNFSMDVFSVGAVLTELFLEESIFDYSKMLDFKNGNFTIEETLSKIQNEKLRKIIAQMLQLDPEKRPTIQEVLKYYAEEICPITIPRALVHFNALLNFTSYWKPDMLIGGIYKHWIQIWKILFGPKCEVPLLYAKLNYSILNKLILKPSFTSFLQCDENNPNQGLMLDNFEFLFDKSNLRALVKEDSLEPELFTKNQNEKCVIIFIDYILQALLNSKYESSNLVGMEMLKHFSTKVSDSTKIQHIIPYFVNMLNYNNITRLTALKYMIEILYMINFDECELTTTFYNFFDSYVFPSILKLYTSGDPILILEFISIIDQLIDLENKFLKVTLKSRLNALEKELAAQNTEQKEEEISTIRDPTKMLRPEESKKKKKEEIMKKHNEQIEEFKTSLFQVIGELISKNEEIDINQMLIRKLCILLDFYGKNKIEDFSRFTINVINKKEWILQKEVLKVIPELFKKIGEDTFINYILICLETLISNNLNEFKITAFLQTIYQLMVDGFIKTDKGLIIIRQLTHYIVHPNIFIREQIFNLLKLLLAKLAPFEILTYLYTQIQPYLDVPSPMLSYDIVEKYSKSRLSRTLYNLKLGSIDYSFQIHPEDEAILIPWMQYINAEINNRMMFTTDESYIPQPENSSIVCSTLMNPLLKEYILFIDKNQGENDMAIDQSFFGKIIWFSDNLATYFIPVIKKNTDIQYKEENNNLISHEQFRIKYIFKVLNVSLPLTCLNKFFDEEGSDLQMYSNPKKEIPNFYFNKNFTTWRPLGQYITTLYPNESIEKLITADNNQFASFDSKGGVILWKVIDNNDNTLSIDRTWSYITDEYKPVSFRNSICSVDSGSFIVGSKNVLYKYSTQYVQNSNSAISKLHTSDLYNDITCALSIGNDSTESQKIVFCNQNGRLNFFDQRVSKVSRYFDIPKQRGIIYCITPSRTEENKIYMGTMGGYLIYFDLRMNYIVNEYKLYSNSPIIGLNNYTPLKLKEFELSSMINDPNNANYLTVWTGAQDHEIGLWNVNTFNFDIIFKVNTLYDNEIKPLTVEIPSITKQSQEMSKEIKEIYQSFDNLSKFTFKYNNNYIKQLLSYNVSGEFYTNSNKRLNKLLNIYEGPSTVQCVASPYCTTNFENTPYLISGGNDKIIRYWDITKEGLNASEKKSFLVNAPSTLSNCIFTKSVYNNTIIIQSNENFNVKQPRPPKKNMAGLSDYQNYNGNAYHSFAQNEYEDQTDNLIYCTKIADPSHQNLITDLLPLNIDVKGSNSSTNLLISSSWDKTIKIWK